MRIAFCCTWLLALPLALHAGAKPAVTVHVEAGKAAGRVSKYLAGACIEDVNHEIYGGLYSQMIFGESFQEPSQTAPVKGFRVYEGKWRLQDKEVWIDGGSGPKLVSDQPAFADGAVGVEVFLPDRKPGNAGLIVRVAKPGPGADNFAGYEVSLNPAANVLTLGRHRHNWELIKDTPYAVPIGRWVPLAVKLSGNKLEVHVDGKSVITYADGDKALLRGAVGLRPWQRAAGFRNLWMQTDGHKRAVPFVPADDPNAGVSGMWRAVQRGSATGRWALETERPFIGTQSQRLAFVSGAGEIGVENQGLNRWGLAFVAGKPYEGYVWARAEGPAELVVGLESRDGSQRYAQARLAVAGKEWQKLPFMLTPDRADGAGRFVVKLVQPGNVALGHAFLQPGAWGRFKGLPVRRDVAEGMIDAGLTVLRYGGSMVNVDGYRWKQMIGPRDRRPPYAGMWYPYSTNGWGIVDFLNLCEAADFLAIPAFNIGETPQDMADFVAYVNGPADAPWGKKRSADGHPAPYRLKHLEFGNEERVDENYWQRFRAVAEAVWAADPEIILVVGDFVYSQPITDPDRFQGAASGITSLAAHRKILELARKHQREVWFDIHIGTEHPDALGELAVVPAYVDALAKIAGGAKHKVAVFELNSGNHAQRRALANAIAVGTLQQLGERLPVVCAANGLQPDGQNDNGWDQGLLFLNPTQVWLQPPGYAARMVGRHYQPMNVPARVQGSAKLTVAAARSADGKTLVLRVVNASDQPISAALAIAGFAAARPTAAIEELAGALDAVNTAAAPARIAPRTRQWQHGLGVGAPTYAFPPRSFTVLTFE